MSREKRETITTDSEDAESFHSPRPPEAYAAERDAEGDPVPEGVETMEEEAEDLVDDGNKSAEEENDWRRSA